MEECRRAALLHLHEGKRTLSSHTRAHALNTDTHGSILCCKWAVASPCIIHSGRVIEAWFNSTKAARAGEICLTKPWHTHSGSHMLSHTLIFGGGNLPGFGKRQGHERGFPRQSNPLTNSHVRTTALLFAHILRHTPTSYEAVFKSHKGRFNNNNVVRQ